MSKASKTRQRLERRKEKRARKEAKKALYESYKAQGKNKKSKRFVAKKTLVNMRKHTHPKGPCGNVGCVKCSPLAKMLRERELEVRKGN